MEGVVAELRGHQQVSEGKLISTLISGYICSSHIFCPLNKLCGNVVCKTSKKVDGKISFEKHR